MYPKKKKKEYIASRLAREALEDMNCPKQIAYEETAKMMIARQITVSMNKEMEELTNLMIKSIIRKEPFICVKLPVKKAFRNVGEKIIYA